MAFTYGPLPTTINIVRMLIADTVDEGHIFEDYEIENAAYLQTRVWQSTQFYNTPSGQNLAPQPIPYYRIAATLLDCIAANKSRLANALKVLDISINVKDAARELRDQANNYREIDDNSGSLMIIEQAPDQFAYRQRWWNTVARQAGGQ